MIYGFIGDAMFKPTAINEQGETLFPPVCFLDDTIENYFEERLTVSDTRSERISPQYTGKIWIYTDASKLPEDNFFEELTTESRNILFGLIETLYMSEGLTQAQLEETLRTDPIYGLVYTQESLRLGTISVGTGVDESSPAPKTMLDSIEFEISLPEGTEKFKLWMNRSEFAKSYPLSTISKVALPCDNTILLNPSKVTTVVDALIQSTAFSFEELASDIATEDHSGLLVYTTKYVVSSTSVKLMPFGILYKGAKPTSLEIRKAIRDKLLSYGTATKEVWENLLPDLFVTGQYFIVPIWDNTVVRPERIMYPSIIKMKTIFDKLETLYPNMDATFIHDKQELLTCAKSEIFLLSIPDPLNESSFSILEQHPTYQFHDPLDPLHSNMELKTKEFSIRLNRCMSILFGETVLEEFVTNTIDGRKYLSFVSSGIEYHVLSEEGYTQ